MYSIYIDTHFVNLVLALYKNEKLVEKQELESNKHSENTIPLLESLLNKYSLTFDDIGEIIVVVGPGSFTGVRIGVVIAKMIGYTKNIIVKQVSYLELLSLNYDEPVTLGIKDRNGAFVASFNAFHELTQDYVYYSNKELEDHKDIVYTDNIPYEKIATYMKEKDAINPHLLKPLYVKKIEVQK